MSDTYESLGQIQFDDTAGDQTGIQPDMTSPTRVPLPRGFDALDIFGGEDTGFFERLDQPEDTAGSVGDHPDLAPLPTMHDSLQVPETSAPQMPVGAEEHDLHLDFDDPGFAGPVLLPETPPEQRVVVPEPLAPRVASQEIELVVHESVPRPTMVDRGVAAHYVGEAVALHQGSQLELDRITYERKADAAAMKRAFEDAYRVDIGAGQKIAEFEIVVRQASQEYNAAADILDRLNAELYEIKKQWTAQSNQHEANKSRYQSFAEQIRSLSRQRHELQKLIEDRLQYAHDLAVGTAADGKLVVVEDLEIETFYPRDHQDIQTWEEYKRRRDQIRNEQRQAELTPGSQLSSRHANEVPLFSPEEEQKWQTLKRQILINALHEYVLPEIRSDIQRVDDESISVGALHEDAGVQRDRSQLINEELHRVLTAKTMEVQNAEALLQECLANCEDLTNYGRNIMKLRPKPVPEAVVEERADRARQASAKQVTTIGATSARRSRPDVRISHPDFDTSDRDDAWGVSARTIAHQIDSGRPIRVPQRGGGPLDVLRRLGSRTRVIISPQPDDPEQL